MFLAHVLPSKTPTAQGQFQSRQDSQLSFLLNARIWLVLTFHNFFLFFFSFHYVNSKTIGVCFVTFLALRPLSTVLSPTHSVSTFDPVVMSEAITVLALVFGRGLKSGILSVVAVETEAGKGCYIYSYKAADHERNLPIPVILFIYFCLSATSTTFLSTQFC